MKRKKPLQYSKYAFITMVITMLVYIIIAFMKANSYYLYLFGISSDEIMAILLLILIILLISGGVRYIYRRLKYKKIMIFCITIVTITSILLIPIHLMKSLGNRYFTFYSDNKEHQIVVNEQSFLLAGYGTVYEVIIPGIMYPVGEYMSDDGYRPFSDKAYSFVWNTDDFVLRYYFGNGASTENDGYMSETFQYIQ